MLKLDKKYQKYLQEQSVEKIFFFFYEAGCSGKKVDVVEDDFENEGLEKVTLLTQEWGGEVFVKKDEKTYFENAIITKTITADHSGKEKIRYIFVNEEVKDRCGCGSSFSFEKKVPKIDLEKLKNLKKNFRK